MLRPCWRAKRLCGGTAAKKTVDTEPEPAPGDDEVDLHAEAERALAEVPEYLRLLQGEGRGKWNFTKKRLGFKGTVQVQFVA